MHTMDEAARLLEAGNMHRAVAAHNLNEHSSRSHAICTVQMEQRLRPGASAGPEAQRFLRSKLHLVDLAGEDMQPVSCAQRGDRLPRHPSPARGARRRVRLRSCGLLSCGT